MGMNPSAAHLLIATVLILAGFASLSMLRILAIYRYSQIVPYDLAREARRLRAEYEARLRAAESNGSGGGDREVTIV